MPAVVLFERIAWHKYPRTNPLWLSFERTAWHKYTRTVELAGLVELEALGQAHRDVVPALQRLRIIGKDTVCKSRESVMNCRCSSLYGCVCNNPTYRQRLHVGAPFAHHGQASAATPGMVWLENRINE